MMQVVNNTPSALKNQIDESIDKAIKRYRENYPKAKIDFSRNRVLTMETMVKLILSMQGGSLKKELYDAGLNASASAFV